MNIKQIKNVFLFMLFTISTQIQAQGITPLVKEGKTSGNKKIFSIVIMNPYNQRMRYEMQAFDKKTGQEQPDIKFSGRKGVIPRYGQKKLMVYIPVQDGDRASRVCIIFPELQEGTIRPRVCGDYTVHVYNR